MAVAKHAMNKDSFYQDAAKYWETVSPDVNGMLGGYGHISGLDISESVQFLKSFLTVSRTTFFQSQQFDWNKSTRHEVSGIQAKLSIIAMTI